jgi:aspartyl-tRNA(Asn)/glutamyl-tRNA(Gln) amidotransferase subunit C
MSVSLEEVMKISHLARVAIDEQGAAKLQQQLSNLFDRVAQMNEVDTTGIMPTTHPLDIDQRLRPDTVTETDQRTLLQKNAPLVEAGLYLVPQVIE